MIGILIESITGLRKKHYSLSKILGTALCFIIIIFFSTSNKTAQRGWAGFLVVILLVISLPNDLVLRLSYSNPALKDNYLWRLIAPFTAWASVAILAALLWLKVRSLASYQHQTTGHPDQGVAND
jgi:hypothetical protein